MINYKKAINFIIEHKTDWKRTCINLIQTHPKVFLEAAVVEDDVYVVEDKKVEGLNKMQFQIISAYLESGMDGSAIICYRAITCCTPDHSRQVCNAIKAGQVRWED